MPNAVAQDLQTYILRRGEKGGTILYLVDVSLNIISMTSVNNDFEYKLTPVFSKGNNLRSILEISNIEDIVLELRFDPKMMQLNSSKDQYPQPLVTENAQDNEKRSLELPSLVSAWLMVLYDILILAESTASSWVIGNVNINNHPNVSVTHFAIKEEKNKKIKPLNWTTPDWNLFLGRNIFSLRWKKFREDILKLKLEESDSVTRLFAAGWVMCVLITTIELIESIDVKFNSKLPNNQLEAIKVHLLNFLQKDVNVFEESVIKAVMDFYKLIQKVKYYQYKQGHEAAPESKVITAAYDILLATEKWLKEEFIYFLSYTFVPLDESFVPHERFDKIWTLKVDPIVQTNNALV